MSNPIIPTPQDTQLLLQDTTTKTASYNAPAMDLGAGHAPGGLGQALAGVVLVSALDLSSGNESYSFVLQDSPDNATFTSIGGSVAVSATGVATVSGRTRQRYVRLALVAGGTTPSITFKAWLNPLP